MPPKKKVQQSKKVTPKKTPTVKKEIVVENVIEDDKKEVVTEKVTEDDKKDIQEDEKLDSQPLENEPAPEAEEDMEEAVAAEEDEVERDQEEELNEEEDEEFNEDDAQEDMIERDEDDLEETGVDETEEVETDPVEIIDDGEDDVIIVNNKDDDEKKDNKESSDKKTKEKESSWVDIIEKERDAKLYIELSKINKLRTAAQKGREIVDLARTHRLHTYPIYLEDLATPFVVDMMKKCTQSIVKFCSSKNTDGEEEYTGFLELTFTKKKDLEESKEKLSAWRQGVKLLVGASRLSSDEFTNDWKTASGLPGNADTNNKLTLFAPSLPESVTNDELWELFGKAREIWLVPGSPRQHAYIKFANEENLQATLTELKSRGPPRADFNFCRLVRFYDVQRVIRSYSGGGQRIHRDSSGHRLSHLNIKAPRDPKDRSGVRQRNRTSSPVASRADSSQPKAPSTATRSAFDKAPAFDSSKTRPERFVKEKNGRERKTRFSDNDMPRPRQRPSQAARRAVFAQNNRVNPDMGRKDPVRRPMDRPPYNADRHRGGYRDDNSGSILGEPPMVPSLLGPPMMNNPSLEMSLNQLQMPMQPQMPPQQFPQQQQARMHDESKQQGLQVLDSLLSTLGQLSHRSDNPVETLANALQSGKGFGDTQRSSRGARDERGYGGGSAMGPGPRRDERRGRSPVKRAPSPRRMSPSMELDAKRRRDMPSSSASLDMSRGRDYSRDIPRDTYAPAPTSRGVADAFKNLPRRNESVVAPRRDAFTDDVQRRSTLASNTSGSRFNSLSSRNGADSYETPRPSRNVDYATLHAETTGEIARMENEYARLMDQLGQSGTAARQTGGAYRQSSYY